MIWPGINGELILSHPWLSDGILLLMLRAVPKDFHAMCSAGETQAIWSSSEKLTPWVLILVDPDSRN